MSNYLKLQSFEIFQLIWCTKKQNFNKINILYSIKKDFTGFAQMK